MTAPNAPSVHGRGWRFAAWLGLVEDPNLNPFDVSKRELRARLERIAEMHSPGSDRWPNTCIVECQDFADCLGTDAEPCNDAGEHELPACQECRVGYDGEPGWFQHPCPTRRAALEGER